jgi:catechol 2,3-dioxygenase-like lactoylglutathione lyase family enzyme
MRFIHTNIAAKDWKALTDFYINVFHCKIRSPALELSGSWLDRAMGMPNVRLEGVRLLLPGYDDHGPTLEIFSYRDAPDGELYLPNRPGLTHIAFEVGDVDQTLKAAVRHGAQPLGRVSKVTINGACDLKFVHFRDPEGNIIEIQSKKKWKRQPSIWLSPAKGGRRLKK